MPRTADFFGLRNPNPNPFNYALPDIYSSMSSILGAYAMWIALEKKSLAPEQPGSLEFTYTDLPFSNFDRWDVLEYVAVGLLASGILLAVTVNPWFALMVLAAVLTSFYVTANKPSEDADSEMELLPIT